MINVLTIAACVTCVVGCLVFVAAYQVKTRGRWMATEVGRLLMLFNADLATICLLVFCNRVFGDWPYRSELTAVLFAAYALQPWWWLRLLWHAQAKR